MNALTYTIAGSHLPIAYANTNICIYTYAYVEKFVNSVKRWL